MGLCVIFCSDGVLCLLGHGSRWTSSKGAKEKEPPRSSRIITIWKVLRDGDSSVVGEQEQGYYCKDTYAPCMYPTSRLYFLFLSRRGYMCIRGTYQTHMPVGMLVSHIRGHCILCTLALKKKKDSPHSSTVKNNWALRKHVYPECCGENQEHASWDLRIWRTKVLSWCYRAGERRINGGKSLRPTELPLQGEKLREGE